MKRAYTPKTAPRGDAMMPPDDLVTDGDILSSLPSLRYEVVATSGTTTETVEGSTSNPADLRHLGLDVYTETRVLGPDHVLSQLIMCNGRVLSKYSETKIVGKDGKEYEVRARPLNCLTLGTRAKLDEGSHKCADCIYGDRAQGRDYLEEIVDTGIGGERPVNKEKMRFLADQLKKRAIQPNDAAFCAMHNALIEVTHSACAHFEAEVR